MRWIENDHSVFGNGQPFGRRIASEVAQHLGRGFVERLDRAGQAEDGITDRNQSAAFTLHGLFSNSPQTEQGHPLPGVYS